MDTHRLHSYSRMITRAAEGDTPVAPERVERKLVTIFAAGVGAYLPFMRADGEATLKTLYNYREVINTLIVRHDGRVSQGFLLRGRHPVG